MATIKCPECGKEISDSSEKCEYCGCPIPKETNKTKKYWWRIALGVLAGVIIVFVLMRLGNYYMSRKQLEDIKKDIKDMESITLPELEMPELTMPTDINIDGLQDREDSAPEELNVSSEMFYCLYTGVKTLAF